MIGDFIVAVNSKRKHKRVKHKRIPIIKKLKPYVKDGLPVFRALKASERLINACCIVIFYTIYETTFYTCCKEYGFSEHALKEYVGHLLCEVGNAYTDLSDEYLLNESKKLDLWE